MEQANAFIYKYSAAENTEIRQIREKYLPKTENKLDELRRLDETVQSSGMAEALCAGIGGALVFGFGMCLAMEVIGSGLLLMILGILIGIVGMVGMIAAYPVYRSIYRKTKEKWTPRILELTAELSGGENEKY